MSWCNMDMSIASIHKFYFGYILGPFVAIITDNDLHETFWWQVSRLHVVCVDSTRPKNLS